MNVTSLFSVGTLFVAASLAGCAADAEPVQASDSDLARGRPAPVQSVTLESTDSATSVQARLFNLLDGFKADADLGISTPATERDARVIAGPGAAASTTSSVSCSLSSMELVAPGGGGFTHRDLYSCELTGFSRIRNGAELPPASVGTEGEQALASKLFDLLAKGEKKGGFGVVKTIDNENPGCCDMPTTSAYEIGDADAKLTCTLHGGGFTGWQTVECTYAHAIKPNE
jgi:hypothetical protein